MAYSEPLVIETVFTYEKENAKLHNTHNYELIHLEPPTSVLRRGQIFNLALRFNRSYEDERDIVRLLFNFGKNPNVFRGTQGIDIVKHKDSHLVDLEAWGVRMINAYETDVMVEVRSPVDSPVGIWQLNIETTTIENKTSRNIYQHDQNIYLLFNPWLKEDLVYMEDKALLDEYILNDVGKIWVGAHGSCRGREWIFGQFDACVLPAIMLMLDKSEDLKSLSRGDPVKVARFISKMVNCYNYVNGEEVFEGILFGRWDGDYEDGTAPAAWTGSVPILEEYLESNGQFVKYGQCWVFAGVVTTICRALGLPSRVVTNVISAHDSNSSLSIDRYYDIDMNPMENDPNNVYNNDSIWNYHVWNDVWMARPDLPPGYGGWQAIDATPQETSEGLYRCGPAPVEAIKYGVVGFNHDVTFMVATVNADVIGWKEDPNSIIGYTRINGNTKHIGRMLLTKAPWIFDPNGDKDREDITLQYKAAEGTGDERLTLYRAIRNTPTAKRFFSIPPPEHEDLEFNIVDLERINIGDPFSVTVNIRNKSTEVRTIKAILWAESVYYNGVKAHFVKRAEGTFSIHPNAREQLILRITVNDYLDKLVEYAIMKLNAVATVIQTNQTWADEDDFQVIMPTVKVEIMGDPVVGRPSTITLSFKNPLAINLTNCKFNYAGPGLSKNKTLHYRDIYPFEEVHVEHQLNPQKSGQQKIIATFTSKELVDLTGSATVDVDDDNEY